MRTIIFALSLISTTVFAQENSNKFSFGSTAFSDAGTISMKQVFNSFGCTGKNISPELVWANPPSGTKSFAITVYDPDAPTGSGWWHWTVFNIPAKIRSLREGENFKPYKKGEELISYESTTQGRTDFGKSGYGGPCPPEGDQPHHYIFTLYAIKEAKLPLNKDSSGAMVGYTLKQNMIEKLSVTAMFGRSAKPAKK